MHLAFGNGLSMIHLLESGRAGAESTKVRVQKLPAMGVFVFPLSAREVRHVRERMDTCGDPWKDRGTASMSLVLHIFSFDFFTNRI